ncbi:hypothetical protein EXS72_02330 [Candidatus Pacearchaeota archaeon]|nr:hypothetical protein [Candidatus Pacearchaeota archaeon]
MVNEEKIGNALYNSEANSFFEDRSLDPRGAKLVQAQTMHDVFYISGNGVQGAYVKLAKKGKDGTIDRKEMDIESQGLAEQAQKQKELFTKELETE